jgi:hypothetical protein
MLVVLIGAATTVLQYLQLAWREFQRAFTAR